MMMIDTRSIRRFFVIAALVVLTKSVVVVDAVLKQVHVVNRHGARYPLPKNPVGLVEGTPGALSQLGIELAFDLGLWLQARYSKLTSSNVSSANPFLQYYTPTSVLIESSRFDRTVVTANSILSGLFGKVFNTVMRVVNVPVYTLSPRDDVTIRAYDKCPAYLNALEEDVYTSSEWQSTQDNYTDFLRRLANITNFAKYVDNSTGIVPLDQLWNVYDAIKVAKDECPNEEDWKNCSPDIEPELVQVLTDDEWNTLGSLVHKTETWRYNSEQAGKYNGRNILRQILARMRNATSTDKNTTIEMGTGKFYLYSAHYPTLLGILGALGKTPIDETEVVPSYTSALIFEYHVNDDDDTDEIQLWYRRGQAAENDNSTNRPVFQVTNFCEDSSTSSKSTSCSLEELWNQLDGWTVQQWCTECGNTNADVCTAQLYAKALASASSNCSNTESNDASTSSNDKNTKEFVGWALFIALAVVVMIGGVFFWFNNPTKTPINTATTNTRMTPTARTRVNDETNDDDGNNIMVLPPTKDGDDVLSSEASTECSL